MDILLSVVLRRDLPLWRPTQTRSFSPPVIQAKTQTAHRTKPELDLFAHHPLSAFTAQTFAHTCTSFKTQAYCFFTFYIKSIFPFPPCIEVHTGWYFILLLFYFLSHTVKKKSIWGKSNWGQSSFSILYSILIMARLQDMLNKSQNRSKQPYWIHCKSKNCVLFLTSPNKKKGLYLEASFRSF